MLIGRVLLDQHFPQMYEVVVSLHEVIVNGLRCSLIISMCESSLLIFILEKILGDHGQL